MTTQSSPYTSESISEKTRIIMNWTSSFNIWAEGWFYGQLRFSRVHHEPHFIGPKRTKPEIIHSCYELVYDKIWDMVKK